VKSIERWMLKGKPRETWWNLEKRMKNKGQTSHRKWKSRKIRKVKQKCFKERR
jgi:hypothetical protein